MLNMNFVIYIFKKNSFKTILFFLILLFSNTYSQGYISYFTGNTNDLVIAPSKGICLMGGSAENDNAMIWFLQKANGGDILIIRSSGSNGYNDYFYSELGVAVNSVETLVITSIAGATNPYVLDKIAKAEAIWFAGGDQANYVNYFKDNALEDAINHHVNIKQGVIGGTSAGMAILGSHYYSALTGSSTTSLQVLSNPYHNSITLGKNDFINIPILQNVITDTHFGNRNRQGRLSTFMARFKQDDQTHVKGLASDESIAICIEANGLAKVYGDFPATQHFAYFAFPNCEPNNNIQTCQPNTALSWYQTYGALKVYKVPGTQTGSNSLDLNDWTTGVGGTWYNWNLENGSFDEYDDFAPNCQPLSLDTLTFNEIVILNPVENQIDFNKNLTGKVEIYSSKGQLLFKKDVYDANKIILDFLDKGAYFMILTYDNQELRKKIIKK